MAPIPRYWYVEAVDSGLPLEPVPVEVVGPRPLAETGVVIDPSTGEVYGEAVLMSTLPWPRFRDFATGKQVVLPHGMAEALESSERVRTLVQGEYVCCACRQQGRHGLHHVRVECAEGKGFASFWCHCTFSMERRMRTAVGAVRRTDGPRNPSHPYAIASSDRLQSP